MAWTRWQHDRLLASPPSCPGEPAASGAARVTHNQRVLELLSDGEPHSHHELYDLRVIAHSRVASLRKQGHTIECWRADGLHWYRLLDQGHEANGAGDSPSSAVPLIEETDTGQMALVAA